MDFSQISSILVVAGVFGLLASFFKQPLIIGYIFAGIVVGSIGVIPDLESLRSLGQIGVTLLLFLLGLEMNLKEIQSIGKPAFLTGLGQIFFTSAIGFFISLTLGFKILPSIYIAIALTFSSTIIMVKLLSEKKDLFSLYGRIAIGFLLIQDIVAILILMFLAGLSVSQQNFSYLLFFVKGLALFVVVWIISKRIAPSIFDKFKLISPEILFVVSVAWALGFSSFVQSTLGFTLEVGGFLAGLSLSTLDEHLQIAAKTRPLRDFFLTLFFILLGSQLVIGTNSLSLIPKALVFSLFVLVGNPIIVLIIMGFLRYKKRTSFLAGLTVAQISEFSLILMETGQKLGHVSSDDVVLVTLVGVITMTTSTYMILYADKIYLRIKNYLNIFERQKTIEQAYLQETKLKNHTVLVGCDRTGRSLAVYFKNKKIPFVVVDFNPSVYSRLTSERIPIVFGDINDAEILDIVGVSNSKILISTINNLSDNLAILEYIRSLREKPLTIFTSSLKSEAIKLYEAGCTYVVVPEVAAGDYIKHLLKSYGDSEALVKRGKKHFERLIFT